MNQTTAHPVSALLQRLGRAGVSVTICDGNLHLQPREKLTPDLLDLCRQHKDDLVRNLRLQSLSGAEWESWHERVAICMVDGKVSQAEAERIAWQQVEQMRLTRPPTVLKHCRCQDCRRLRDGRCAVGILVSSDCPPSAWHYCAEYLGPAISPHTFVWSYDDAPAAQQAAHVGPRAQEADAAMENAARQAATQRGPP